MLFMSTLIRYVVGVIFTTQAAAAVPDDPNLVIIMSDEHNLKTLGCYKSQLSRPLVWGEGVEVDTRNIDALASDGAIFTNFNAVAPLCTPSRASFMSGLFPFFTGASENHSEMNKDIVTFAEILQNERGYSTGYVGKWHLNGDEKPGFSNDERPFGFTDNKYQFNRGHWKLFDEDARTGEVSAYEWKKQKKFKGSIEDAYATDFLFRKGTDFMETQIRQKKPFALMLSIPDPHGPNDVRSPYDTMYNDMNFKIPPSGVAAFNGKPALPGWSRVKSNVEFDLKTANATIENIENADKWQRDMRNYFGMVKLLDDKVGELLSFLEEEKQTENTIVVFTSDHGDMLGEHGKYNKGTPYQTSAGVPFIIRYPARVKKQNVIKTAYSSPDFAPTILGLMGVDYSDYTFQGIDGSHEILSDTRVTAREQVRFITDSKKAKWAAAVDRQYKLVLSRNGDPWLFDLEKDPDEIINYARDSSYSEIMSMLQQELIRAMGRYKLPLRDTELVYINPPACSDAKDQIPGAPYRVCEDLREKEYRQLCLDEEVIKFCPTMCGLCCKDSTGTMYFGRNREVRGCNSIKDKELECKNKQVRKFCPLTCSNCISEPSVRFTTDMPTIFARDTSQETNDAPRISHAVATCGHSKNIVHCNGHEKVLNKSEKAAVRCCSDTAKPSWIQHDGCNIWATSRIQGKCRGNKTWLDAKAICEGVGARLCTTEEVYNDCTKKTGCRSDIYWIWTSSLIKTSSEKNQ